MWQVYVRLEDETSKTVCIQAIRTDPVTDEKWSYSCTAIIRTAAQRTKILDKIKASYIAHLEFLGTQATILAGLANTATNALNSWEETL